jgi:probable rRNA maturation factor
MASPHTVYVTRRGDVRARVGKARVGGAAEAMLRAMKVGAAELSVVLCDDDTIHALNATYRKKNKPTDVLAFALEEGAPQPRSSGAPRLLGDVIISIDTARRQADERGIALFDEVLTLLAHGLLHLLGYDHQNDADERAMNTEVARIVARAKRAIAV